MLSRKIKVLAIAALIPIFSMLVFVGNASAIDQKLIMDKAMLQGLYNCYKLGANLNNDDKKFPWTQTFGNISDLKKFTDYYNKSGYNSDLLPFPTGKAMFNYDSGYGTLYCGQVVNGYDSGDIKGIFERRGHPFSKTTDWLMKYAGYESTVQKVTSDTKKCIHFNFNLLYTPSGAKKEDSKGIDYNPAINGVVDASLGDGHQVIARTSDVCADVDKDGNITSVVDVKPYKDAFAMDQNYPNNDIYPASWGKSKENACGAFVLMCHKYGTALMVAAVAAYTPVPDDDGIWIAQYAKTNSKVINGNYTFIGSVGKKWDAFIKEIENNFKTNELFSHGYDSATLKPIEYSGKYRATRYLGYEASDAAEVEKHVYGFQVTENSANIAVGNLLGLDKTDEATVKNAVALTLEEKIALYAHYLVDKEIYGAVVDCSIDVSKIDEAQAKSYYGPINWFEEGATKPKKCVITKLEDGEMKTGEKNVQIVDDNGWFIIPSESKSFTGEFQDVLNFFMTLPDDTKLEKPYSQTRAADPDPGEDVSEDPSCYDNAGGLGIAICPIIQVGTSFMQNWYEGHIVPFLQTNPALLSEEALVNDKPSGAAASTVRAWTIFQGFANVAFIGIFLFVIFSQISGVGLDNYGIKKVLPKLIIGAILINLSYVICQLAVDVANIVGSGIKGIFENIGSFDQYTLAANGIGNHDYFKAGLGVSLFIVIIAVIGGAAWLTMGPAILIPIVTAVIVGVIAYIGLFVMLALRTALTVMLIVFSPLAFLCYILQGTKSIFSKWLNAFKGVLLAYPICSVMIYGGEAAGRIMLMAMGAQEEGHIGFSEALAAAIMSIGPIFMIPSVLKKSMGALGGITDRLSHAAKGAASRGIRNTGTAEDLRRRQALHRGGLRYNKDTEKLEVTGLGKFREKMAFGRYSKNRLNRTRNTAANDFYGTELNKDYLGENANESLRRLGNTYKEDQRAKKIQGNESDMRAGDFKYNKRNADGTFELDDKGQPAVAKLNPNDLSGLKDALVDAILKGNDEQAEALQNLLAANGGKGVDATHQAIREAAGMVTDKNKDKFNSTMGKMSVNALNKHGGYKNSDLALNEMMKQYASGNGGNVADYDGITSSRIQDMELSNIAGASKGSLKTMIGQINRLSGDDRKAAVERLQKIREDAKRSGTSLDGAHEDFFNMVDKIGTTGSLTKDDREKVNGWSKNEFTPDI